MPSLSWSPRSLAVALALASALAADSADGLDGVTLASDDECAGEEGEGCVLHALQFRSRPVASEAQVTIAALAQTGWGWASSCAQIGCHGNYQRGLWCQCNEQCSHYNNCCSDYWSRCRAPAPTLAPTHAPTPSPNSIPSPRPSLPGPYRKVWAAEGESFFDGWDFKWKDSNHGAPQFLLRGDAEKAGVVKAYSTHAILRTGERSPQWKFKRQTAKIVTKRTWNHFLVAMKYEHLPYGCGVWPAFFTLAPNYPWPQGGEMDILEYVNMDVSKSSFHTGHGCKLNQRAVFEEGNMPDRNNMQFDCETAYPDKLGCAPNKWMRTGEQWSNSPGVVAMQWTEEFIKIFSIPEREIPEDLTSESPDPETWSRWLVSYYPLRASGCGPQHMRPQQLIMQINFCGDWASKVWSQDNQCKHLVQGCRAVDPLHEFAPEQDCCTQFIWDEGDKHGTNEYLHSRAFFNISHIKVFQQR